MRDVYWDGGPNMIKKFHEQHDAACGSNWVCNGLHLATTEVKDKKLTTPKKVRKPGPLRHG